MKPVLKACEYAKCINTFVILIALIKNFHLDEIMLYLNALI